MSFSNGYDIILLRDDSAQGMRRFVGIKRNMKGEIMSKKLVINTAWCKGCGVCVAFCPKKALVLRKEKAELVKDGGCILCGQCELRCPDYAIYIEEDENE